MNFQQLLLILRARLRTVLTALAVTVLVSVVINLLLPKSYEAATTLVVNFKAADPLSGAMMPAAMMDSYIATQVDIIQSKAVAISVVDSLRLAEAPSLKADFESSGDGGELRDWVADLLLKKLDVMPAREGGIITVTYTGTDPVFAAAVANGFATEYQKTSVRLKAQPLKQASAYFNEQSKGLRDKLEQAQARLSKYQQEKGIVNVDTRLDIEMARLRELSTQLVLSQGQMADATSRQNPASGAAAQSPDVIGNGLVQNLTSELARAEAKLSELSARLSVNHPQYLAAKAEAAKLRAELDAQVALTYNSLGNNSRISQRREAEVRAAVAAQKSKILELNRERDELSVLTRDVEAAQRNYDAAITRFAQTSMEGGANLAEVAVLSPALPPARHSSPRVLVNLILSIIFGTTFGAGIAILMELIHRRVHSTYDLEDLKLPLLAELNWSARVNPQSGSPAPVGLIDRPLSARK